MKIKSIAIVFLFVTFLVKPEAFITEIINNTDKGIFIRRSDFGSTTHSYVTKSIGLKKQSAQLLWRDQPKANLFIFKWLEGDCENIPQKKTV